jgi:endophilin-A
MILEEQLNESALQSATTQRDMILPPEPKNNTSNGSENHMHPNHKDALYIAKVRCLITLNIPPLLSNPATPERKK